MPFPFVSFKKLHGGLKVLDADLDAIRFGLLRDHYLIEVEYILEGSTVVDQVFHKSLSNRKLFFNREDVNIIKCQCLQEKEFLSYISETNRIVNKNKRAESRQMQATAAIELNTIQHESANHDELSATTDVSNYCNFIVIDCCDY